VPGDTDGDGIRNLSNIVVTYNHLGSDLLVDPFVSLQSTTFTIVEKGETLGHTHPYYFTDRVNVNTGGPFRWCSRNLDAQTDDCKVTEAGRGTICEDAVAPDECPRVQSSDHLHLEVAVARGGYTPQTYGSLNSIRINPLLMFSSDYFDAFTTHAVEDEFDPYFPIDEIDLSTGETTFHEDNENLLGINAGEITALSGQNDLPDRDPGARGFYQIQNEATPGPEWWILNGNDDQNAERVTTDIKGFLHNFGYPPPGYAMYVGPNCVPDVNNLAICTVNYNDLGGRNANGDSFDDWDPLRPTLWPTPTGSP
jgi:hypothetical protein